MSKNTKRILIILIVAIAVCIVGAAAAIGGVGLLAERFKNNIATDPKKVQDMAHEFINYELPPGYSEKMGMDFLVYKMIMIGGGDDEKINSTQPMILLAHFQETQGMTPEEMSAQMQKSLAQQNGNKGADMKLVETRKVTINGQETTLSVNEGTDASGDTLRQWVTTCPGKTGLVMILIQGDTANWDDAPFNDFLASIGN